MNHNPTVSVVPSRFLPLLALLLLVPLPSIGTAAALVFEATRGTLFGQGVYMAGKVGLLVIPLIWFLKVEGGRLRVSFWDGKGLGFGLLSGLVIGAFIIGAYYVLGPSLIDPVLVRETAAASGLDHRPTFTGFALYICLVNATLEEYVWRWFVFRQCEQLTGKMAAVPLAALLFTLHHIVALSVQFNMTATVLCSLGVFVGGCVWSWFFMCYRKIWPGVVSHIVVDIAIFWIAYQLIFG